MMPTRDPNSFSKTRRGSVLLPVVAATLILALVGSALAELFGSQRMSSVLNIEATQAFWSAEAGLWHAAHDGAEITSAVSFAGSTYTVDKEDSVYTATAIDGDARRTLILEVDLPPQDQVVYLEDFDTGAPTWTKTSGSSNLWRTGSDCVSSSSPMLTFSRASPKCDYNAGRVKGSMTSGMIDITGKSTAILGFQHFWQIEKYPGKYDRMYIQVRGNGSSSWKTLKENNSLGTNPSGFVTEAFDVSSYISTDFQIRFTFDSVDSQYNDFLGWYIDNVTVTIK